MAVDKQKKGLEEGPVLTRERAKARPKKPRMYRVVMLNDDYTPMEFVVFVLQVVFSKAEDEATRLMLDVHNHGKGICGVFSFDVARTKARQVEEMARRHEHPLQCELETVETE
jgi:ATP-dependent Clp protease adaptor protein ClpS